MKWSFACLPVLLIILSNCKTEPIDRFALVARHNIKHSSKDSLSSLSVGNGEFAFTTDITGLQTFPDDYSHGVPLGTMSDWGWHTDANPENYNLSDVYQAYNVNGRSVEYVRQFSAGDDKRKGAATEWLRANPHRMHLGVVGLQILKKDRTEIS